MAGCTCNNKGICNSCLISAEERNAAALGPAITVKKNGEYALGQIDVFEKEFQKTITAEVANNPLSEAVKRYGDSFHDSVRAVNNDFLKRPYVTALLPNYEIVNKRLESGGITSLEFASFIKDMNYTPSSVIASYNANAPRFLNELDGYYANGFSNSIMGGFCSLFGSVFAAIGGFFDLIDGINGLVNDVFEFLNKIKNIEDPIKALFEKIKVKALIEAIKEKITKTVDKALKKIQSAIENFSIENVMGEIQNFIDTQIVGRINKIKDEITQFFTKENMDRIKAKIQGLIDYAVGLFANPSLEEIQFLIARLCGFAAGIEGLINGLKAPLDDFSNRYDEVLNTISNASNRIVGESIRSGAVRLAEEVRQEQINNARQAWEAAGAIEPLPQQNEFNFPTWEEVRDKTSNKVIANGNWATAMTPPHEGWTNLTNDVKIRLMRLHRIATERGIISGPLKLNSGYRNEAYNRSVGGVDNSLHTDGKAADLGNTRGMSVDQRNRFIQAAYDAGFLSVGVYGTFVHVSYGSERGTWYKT